MGGRSILMVGTDLPAHGGISSVLSSYRDFGVFDAWDIEYEATFVAPGMLTQIQVFGAALVRIIFGLILRRYQLVHVHTASRGSFWRKSIVAAVAKIFGVPYVFHIHSGEFPTFYHEECGAVAKSWVRWVLRNAAYVVVLTEHWKSIVRQIEPRVKVESLGNPVEVPAFLQPLRQPPRTILFLGRLHAKKGIFELVRAIKRVLPVFPDVRFVLAGDGEMAAVRKLAEDLGVSDSVDLPGWVSGADKVRWLEQGDVFVLPTHFEALSVGLLEAMSYGVPIVSTAVGGIPDLITHDVEGLLVPAEDEVELAAAILALLENSTLCERLRQNAFARVGREYSFEAILVRLRRIYSEIGVHVSAFPARRVGN